MLRIILLGAMCLMAFRAAHVPETFSPYQVKLWAIKAYESHRSDWYPDGPGKCSIGLGYNDWGLKSRRDKISWAFDKNKKVSFKNAVKITLIEIESMKLKVKDPWVKAAFELHIYNTGKCKTINDLRGCCKSSVGCGSPNKDVRKSHNPRRKLEFAMATHDFHTVFAVAYDLQRSAAQLDRLNK